jgi:hypothetical protein
MKNSDSLASIESKPQVKAAFAKVNSKENDSNSYQVAKKDGNGKEIEFFQWFPSSLLSKPARSPVCSIIFIYEFCSTNKPFKNFYFIYF